LQEWTNFQGRWQKLPFAVGAIDGTSTEIYRPGIEPQEHYYSGNRRDLYLLGDKIYPNLHPIMTPYTRQQIARKPLNLQQKCRKMKTYHRIPC
jgi:hypothetical protein